MVDPCHMTSAPTPPSHQVRLIRLTKRTVPTTTHTNTRLSMEPQLMPLTPPVELVSTHTKASAGSDTKRQIKEIKALRAHVAALEACHTDPASNNSNEENAEPVKATKHFKRLQLLKC